MFPRIDLSIKPKGSSIVQEKFVFVKEHKIRYLEGGKSDNVIIFLHGLGASAERWEYVLPSFEKHFRLFVPDLIGFGHSDKPSVDYTINFFVDFLGNFLDAIEVERFHLVGSSLGGQITAEFTASNNNRVKRLVLVSPSGVMKTSTPALDAYIMAALYPSPDTVKNAFEEMAVSSEPIAEHILRDFEERMKLPNAKMAFMSTLLGLKNSEDIRHKLNQIAVPTLLVWGDQDPIIPKIHAKKFAEAIPCCTLLCMKGSGHTPYVDSPQQFFKKVMEFLDA